MFFNLIDHLWQNIIKACIILLVGYIVWIRTHNYKELVLDMILYKLQPIQAKLSDNLLMCTTSLVHSTIPGLNLNPDVFLTFFLKCLELSAPPLSSLTIYLTLVYQKLYIYVILLLAYKTCVYFPFFSSSFGSLTSGCFSP